MRLESASSAVSWSVVEPVGLEQQPSDERALAVVDAAAGDEAQQLLALFVAGRGLAAADRHGRLASHQKYPM